MDLLNPSKSPAPFYYFLGGQFFKVNHEHNKHILEAYLCESWGIKERMEESSFKEGIDYTTVLEFDIKKMHRNHFEQLIGSSFDLINKVKEDGLDFPKWIVEMRKELINSKILPGNDPKYSIYVVDPNSTFSSAVENILHPLSLEGYSKDIYQHIKAGHLFMTYEEIEAYSKSLMESKYNLEGIKEIEESRYYDLLECLPPKNWTNGIFQLREYTEGQYTGHAVDMGGRYFYGVLHHHTKYSEIKNYIRQNLL